MSITRKTKAKVSMNHPSLLKLVEYLELPKGLIETLSKSPKTQKAIIEHPSLIKQMNRGLLRMMMEELDNQEEKIQMRMK